MRQATMHNWGSDSDMETLAAIVKKSDRNDNLTPGIGFVRSQQRPEAKANKDEARGYVCGLFSAKSWPGPLRIFTLPGLEWRAEKSLLKLREPERSKGIIERTFITAIEREPPLFTAALNYIPGADLGLEHHPGDAPKMVCSMSTPLINRFHLGTFEDYAETSIDQFDAAWVDLTGPLTLRLVGALPVFWRRIRSTLVLTMLNARWCNEISHKVAKAGGVDLYTASLLHGSVLTNIFRYTDKVPMIQLTFRR